MDNSPENALISACLLGFACRYDGKHKYSAETEKLKQRFKLVPVCPEQLGGLPTPRPPAEIRSGNGGDVLDGTADVVQTETGCEVTNAFISGARETLRIAVSYSARRAFLKSRSPSCGCGGIVVEGKIIPVDGVTTALLKRNGIEVEAVE